RSAPCSRHDSLESRTGGYKAFRNIKLRDVHSEIVLSVSYRAREQLYEIFGRALGGIFENSHCGCRVLASDKIEHDLDLARRNSGIPEICTRYLCFHCTLSSLRVIAIYSVEFNI